MDIYNTIWLAADPEVDPGSYNSWSTVVCLCQYEKGGRNADLLAPASGHRTIKELRLYYIHFHCFLIKRLCFKIFYFFQDKKE